MSDRTLADAARFRDEARAAMWGAVLRRAARPRGAGEPAGGARTGIDAAAISAALVAFLFGVTAPIAVILTVASRAGLSQGHIVSWIWAAYTLGGALTIVLSLATRQALVFNASMLAAVILGPALARFTVAEVVGACIATGILVAALGLAGLDRRLESLVPMPIVMAMIAGAFLPFGINIVAAFDQALWIALPAVAAFVAISVFRDAARSIPPLLAALIAGIAASLALGAVRLEATPGLAFAEPLILAPELSLRAMIELVVPLTVTVVAINNAQGFALLRHAGEHPPVSPVTTVCGAGTIAFALTGGVPTSLAGVVMGIINGLDCRRQRICAAVLVGSLFLLFGLFAASAASLALALPRALIVLVGGIALVGVLQGALVTAFRGRLGLGALVTFIVTISGTTILNVGAAFWGLLFGLAAAWLFERGDLGAAIGERAGVAHRHAEQGRPG